ncbi:hypothetical protein [Enhygromyxa salina]|uniref:Uncharacterized protein n=1 Tax=Enhygromyxa salina TaxID=215803 RepID=A0A2S9YMJ8_9BACT|nr:hypothetical protein [Enhygromyxa salina]PRQ06310.1 hypothetical protein ENSA7_39870 [Enhygromyxa salina]
MNDNLQKLLILVGATALSLTAPGCDLDDKNIGETGETDDGDSTGDVDPDPIGDGDGDPTGDGDATCPPPDGAVEFSYGPANFNLSLPPFDTKIDWTCTVAMIDNVDDLSLELDCPNSEDPMLIQITAEPGLSVPLAQDDIVRVRYTVETPFWSNLYLRLDLEGYGHVLTLVDGDSLTPDDAGTFELPFGVSAASANCAPVDTECGMIDRLALTFDSMGEPTQIVFDGDYGNIQGEPGANVWLTGAQNLTQHPNMICTDVPASWYQMLIVDAN